MPAPTPPYLCPKHQSLPGVLDGNPPQFYTHRDRLARRNAATSDLPEWPRSQTSLDPPDPSIEITAAGLPIKYRDQEVDKYWEGAEMVLERSLKDMSLTEPGRESMAKMLANIREHGNLEYGDSCKYSPYPDLFPDVTVLTRPGSEIFKSGSRQNVGGFDVVQTHRFGFDESTVIIFIPQRGSEWVNPVTRTAEKVKVWKQYRDQQLSRGVLFDIDGYPFGEEPRAYVRALRSVGLKYYWWVVPKNLPAGIGIYFRKPEDVIKCIYRKDAHRFLEKSCKCVR